MLEFWTIYRKQIIAVIIVIAAVALLRILTRLLHRWLVKKEKQKFPGESARSFNIVKRVLNILWMVLGALVLIMILTESDKNAAILSNFKLTLYLGIVIVLTIVAAASTNMWFKKSVKRKITMSEDPTAYKFLRYVAVFAIYFTGFLFCLLAFPSLRGVAQTALGGAGVIALIAGVASQEALSNLVGGIFIISFKPFKIGDIIEVTDTMVGTVTDITLRHTVIRNFQNKMIVIPNAIINKEKLVNYDLADPKCCEHIKIHISYDSDVKRAKEIMQEECENHPLIFDNRSILDKKDGKPIVKTALTHLNDSSVTIRAWAWCRNYDDSWTLQCDVKETIKARFTAENIEIPHQYRTIVMKEDYENQVKTMREGNESQTEDI